jgi:hypothetical protein
MYNYSNMCNWHTQVWKNTILVEVAGVGGWARAGSMCGTPWALSTALCRRKAEHWSIWLEGSRQRVEEGN